MTTQQETRLLRKQQKRHIRDSALSTGPDLSKAEAMSYKPNPPAFTPLLPEERMFGRLEPLSEWLKINSIGPPKSASRPFIKPHSVDPADKMNWVGKLMDYWTTQKKIGKFEEKFLDEPSPQLFSCTVTLVESPDPFGGDLFPFLRKKDAKQNAAKLAVQYLIQKGHLVEKRIVTKTTNPKSRPNQAKAAASKPVSGESNAAQVQRLAHKLGMKSPAYVIELVSADAVALFKGYASFKDEPLLAETDKVAAFDGVWSKKAAKEHCAAGVLRFFQEFERRKCWQEQKLAKRMQELKKQNHSGPKLEKWDQEEEMFREGNSSSEKKAEGSVGTESPESPENVGEGRAKRMKHAQSEADEEEDGGGKRKRACLGMDGLEESGEVRPKRLKCARAENDEEEHASGAKRKWAFLDTDGSEEFREERAKRRKCARAAGDEELLTERGTPESDLGV